MNTHAAHWASVMNGERKSTKTNARGELRVMDVGEALQPPLQPSGVVLQQFHGPLKDELEVSQRCNMSRNGIQPARYKHHDTQHNLPQVNCTRSLG